MSSAPAQTASSQAPLVVAAPNREARRRGPWSALAVVTLAVVGLGLWGSGIFSPKARSQSTGISFVEVDRGDIAIDIVESGTLESTNNATVRCQVEALIGTVGGQVAGSGGGGRGGNRGGGTGTSQPKSTSGGLSAAAGFGGASKTGAAAGKLVGSTKASSKSAATTTAVAATTTVAVDPAAAAAGVQPLRAPTITSFSYKVTPHVPLRPKSTAAPKPKATPQPQGGGFGGGGMEEQRGSTRILTILPEGTPVQAGDVVCTLDSAPFEDELMAQKIRHDQAKAWVEQAKSLLEVNEISLREYKEGTLPKDRDLIEGYLQTTSLELDRARTTLQWSREAYDKGFRTGPQLKSDELAIDRAELQSKEARTMKRRLEEFSAPRLLRNLEAKSASIRADLLAQEQALKLEVDRLKKLEKIIDYCKMTAPRDGIVVYANQSSGWGRAETQIREGVTVRERQPIFNLPDPNKMSVRVRINESKIASITKGQKTEILIDAFHDRPLEGTVKEVTVIPAPANGPFSDVKIYNALVEIDSGGFEGLRPGLSAQVAFHMDDREGVVRVPVGALRWVDNRPWAARQTSSGDLEWVKLRLGSAGSTHAEVISGLEPGDRVAADPRSLPAPILRPAPDA